MTGTLSEQIPAITVFQLLGKVLQREEPLFRQTSQTGPPTFNTTNSCSNPKEC